ncbi:MAG: phospho-N-acetylmuramoyl-pentapeptide-transferase [Candidatus Delongbacteria bacterium]
MLTWLANLLREELGGPGFLRLFNYISFRTVMAAMTTFVVSLIIGGRLIRFLHLRRIRDVVEDYGVIDVSNKRGTPTMGGLLMILSILTGYGLWFRPDNPFSWAGLSALLWFGLVGLMDDWGKLKGGSGKHGLSQSAKLALQALYATGFALWLLSAWSPLPEALQSQLYLPFVKGPVLELGWWSVPWTVLVFLSVSNSVNFADGMDGLAVVPAAISFMVYAVFAYVLGNEVYSQYLQFQYVRGVGELAVLGGAVIGAGLGFLWYNFFPAQVFMGDTGSMALGGLLSAVMLLMRQEVLFLIVGGVFVLEGASVLIQEKIGIGILGRRIFYRAPIHHAFEHRGVAETKVVIRFWIIALFLGFLGLLSLKIR